MLGLRLAPNTAATVDTSFCALVTASGAPPPETLAVFTSVPAAPGSTFTYTYIFSVSSGANTTGASHRTDTGSHRELRFCPPSCVGKKKREMLCTVKPAGSVSAITMGLPSVDTLPTFLTVTSYTSHTNLLPPDRHAV